MTPTSRLGHTLIAATSQSITGSPNDISAGELRRAITDRLDR